MVVLGGVLLVVLAALGGRWVVQRRAWRAGRAERCPHCGRLIDRSISYCPRCGEVVHSGSSRR